MTKQKGIKKLIAKIINGNSENSIVGSQNIIWLHYSTLKKQNLNVGSLICVCLENELESKNKYNLVGNDNNNDDDNNDDDNNDNFDSSGRGGEVNKTYHCEVDNHGTGVTVDHTVYGVMDNVADDATESVKHQKLGDKDIIGNNMNTLEEKKTKKKKKSRILAKIEVHTSSEPNQVYISSLLSKNLYIQCCDICNDQSDHQISTEIINQTILIYLKTTNSEMNLEQFQISSLPIAKRVKLQFLESRKTKYSSSYISQCIKSNFQLNGPIYFFQKNLLIESHVCEKPLQFFVNDFELNDTSILSKTKKALTSLNAFGISKETQFSINYVNKYYKTSLDKIIQVNTMSKQMWFSQTMIWIQQLQSIFPGYSIEIQKLIKTISFSLYIHYCRQNNNAFNAVDVMMPRGIIIHGESGTGKSTLIEAMKSVLSEDNGAPTDMGLIKWSFKKINGSDFFQSEAGQSESRLKQIFLSCINEQEKNKIENHQKFGAHIIAIEDLDSLSSEKRYSSTSGRLEKLVQAELISCFELIHKLKEHFIFVIGVTNKKLEHIDASLKCKSRFDQTLQLKVPAQDSREEIISYMLKKYKTKDDIKSVLQFLIMKTQGFVAADIKKLFSEASLSMLKRNQQVLEVKDFENVLDFIKPSLLLSVNAENMNMGTGEGKVSFGDLAGIDPILQQLKISLMNPLLYQKQYLMLGISPPKGVLLYGPPGVGKTTLAKAIAHEIKANFLSVQCPDVISKVVGESSRLISNLFQQARGSAPCVLFFDQFEAIARSRGYDSSESQSSDRMLSTLLIEMDGISSTPSSSLESQPQSVIILAATNRIDMLDAAILRPGRIDQHIKMDLPNADARYAILKEKTKMMNIDMDVDLKLLAKQTEKWSGADLENLCREAAMVCLRENIDNKCIKHTHFQHAKSIIRT